MTAAVTWSPSVTRSAPHSLPTDNCDAAIFCCTGKWAEPAWRQHQAPRERGRRRHSALNLPVPLGTQHWKHCRGPLCRMAGISEVWDGSTLIQGSTKPAQVWAVYGGTVGESSELRISSYSVSDYKNLWYPSLVKIILRIFVWRIVVWGNDCYKIKWLPIHLLLS